MRLLIVTQVVDRTDPVLGFFHGWLTELATRFEHLEVICLYEGIHDLPSNVRVHSLGKEQGKHSRVSYAARFLWLAWKLRHEYDAVFVHMNQEYLLIGGWLWRLLGKPMYLWRNHYAGSGFTDIAALWCEKVFCTSKHSYTARYHKTVLMPVGIDTDRFYQDEHAVRTAKSILFLARMSPAKRPHLLVEALGTLIGKGVSFTSSIYGSPTENDVGYYENLKHQVEREGLHDRVRFYPGVANEKVAGIFRAHDIVVNCSPSGMYDKTLFEAAASGCRVIAVSEDWKEVAGEALSFEDADTLAERLAQLLTAPADEVAMTRRSLAALAADQSLSRLADQLVKELA